jgi:hypothetical protein
MKYVYLALALILTYSSTAQYRGGNNDGVSQILVSNQNALPAIYHGGSNDGYAISSVFSQNPIPGIYLGGTNDGVAFASVLGQNAIPGIYLGGSNDGVSAFSITGQNAIPGIYLGGMNDGYGIVQALTQNALPGIYAGGIADGVAINAVTNGNPLPPIYAGGTNDGYSISMSANQNLSVPLPPPINPLPVTLLNFTGSWFNIDAVLAWKTASENSLDHFELQRSDNGGVSFTFVASVGPNNMAGQHDYRYTDLRAYELPADFLLYRLKCLDKNGDYKYSAIVKLSKDKTAPIIVAYPNPTSGSFTLSMMNVSLVSAYTYILSTTDGKLIKTGKLQENNTSFDLRGYAPSAYHLTLFKDAQLVQHFTILLTQ